MARKTVRFLRPWGVYNTGERAGFEAQKADNLVRLGHATLASAEKAETPVAVEEPEEEVPKEGTPEATDGDELDRLGTEELRELAEEAEIPYASRMKHETLLERLREVADGE